jgi:hypothetical protein
LADSQVPALGASRNGVPGFGKPVSGGPVGVAGRTGGLGNEIGVVGSAEVAGAADVAGGAADVAGGLDAGGDDAAGVVPPQAVRAINKTLMERARSLLLRLNAVFFKITLLVFIFQKSCGPVR